jgi:exopolysaccharide biosynthesis polyprenyl glycosylphosphotransferase
MSARIASPGYDASAGPTVQPLTRPQWHRHLPKVSLAAADLIMVVAAMVVAFVVKPILPGAKPAGAQDQYLLVGTVSLPVWLLAFARYRLYRARHVTSRLDEFTRIVHAAVAGVVGTTVLCFGLKLYVARGWIFMTLPFAVALLASERAVARRLFARLREGGRMLRPTVIVGANAEGLALGAMLTSDPGLGYRVLGYVDDVVPLGHRVLGSHDVIGRVDNTVDSVVGCGASTVVIATTAVDAETSNRLARSLTELGLKVELSSSLCDIASERLVVRPLGRFPVIYVEPVRRHGWRMAAKRTFDIVVSLGTLIGTSPVLLLAAMAIKVDSKGPVLFRQKRLGQHGEHFDVLKLRTMVTNAEQLIVDLRDKNEADGPLFKMKDDPRVTRVGALLRKLSIDELPQLWNVLKGDMTLVGPRPALPSEVAAWTPQLHQRLRVKPGITGMWQVSGRSSASFDDYVRYDLYYVDNWSLLTDVSILFRTIPAVLMSRGAC